MPALAFKGALWIGGGLLAYFALRQSEDTLDAAREATDATTRLVQIGTVAGGGYFAYQLAKSGGLIK